MSQLPDKQGQPQKQRGRLRDKYDRTIDYLRIAVTDRCNLRCFYCMPERGVKFKPHDEILTYEEIERFAKAAVKAGIRKIRLTGGEPLVRKDIVRLVAMLAGIPGLKDLALTTNGVLLPRHGEALKKAGLKRINISLDSLDPKVYERLSRVGNLNQALAGMRKALDLGMNPVKVNAVLAKGINDNPEDFVKLIYDYPVHVRFIEFMPTVEWGREFYLPIDEFKESLEKFGPILPVDGPQGAGPARYITFDGALGTLGFISPISNHFCGSCNRLRLTSDGKLRLCLFSDQEFDVRTELRQGATERDIISFIRQAVDVKPERHHATEQEKMARLMCQIGG